ncbi:hypothetical protein D770_03695 [Flammeovirgaceae bacterium 311]|nr:hypothetical protein D770_03695 [Flammeovirgaceae bacterium 311]
MAITVLKRKKLKNRLRAQKRVANIKQLTSRPPIKKVDVEEIKATFTKQEEPKKKQAENKEQE